MNKSKKSAVTLECIPMSPADFLLFLFLIFTYKLRRTASAAFAAALLRIRTTNTGLPTLFSTHQITDDRSRNHK